MYFLAFSTDIYLWHKNVDDILCVWSDSDASLYSFYDTLNSHHPKLKSTIEKDGNTINFLDLKITLVDPPIKGTLAFEFDIFRKPTFTGRTVHEV